MSKILYRPKLQTITSVKNGALYNARAVLDARGMFAEGWFMPFDTEYQTLLTNIGCTFSYPNYIDGGKKLKEIGTTYWDTAGGLNNYGFNLRGAGYRRSNDGIFTFLRTTGCISRCYTDGEIIDYRTVSAADNNDHISVIGPYGTNMGVGVRPIKSVTTLSNGQSGTYIGNDGKVYRTICIGTQEWLADNLIETKFKKDYPEYGYLYNWYVGTDIRNIANVGWQVPSLAQWQTLADYLGAGGNYTTNSVGAKLREVGTAYWTAPNTGATNSAKFNARGIRGRGNAGNFDTLKSQGHFWATDENSGFGQPIILYYNSNVFYCANGINAKDYGKALRLVNPSTLLTNGQEGTYTGNDGKIYRTICIGTQEWLADNLAETEFRTGEPLTKVTVNATWAALTTAAYCAHTNDEAYVMLGTDIPIVTDNSAWAALDTAGMCYYNNDINNA